MVKETQLACGCRILAYSIIGARIHYCPKHAAAPMLYDALKQIVEEDYADGASDVALMKGVKALEKAEDKSKKEGK